MTKEKLNQLQALLDEARSEMYSLAHHTEDDSFKKFLSQKGAIFTTALNSLPCLEEDEDNA